MKKRTTKKKTTKNTTREYCPLCGAVLLVNQGLTGCTMCDWREPTYPQGRFDTIRANNHHGRPITVKTGDRIRFRRPDHHVAEDTVRDCFYAYVLMEPYARNYSEPAVVLTDHSWTRVADIVEVL